MSFVPPPGARSRVENIKKKFESGVDEPLSTGNKKNGVSPKQPVEGNGKFLKSSQNNLNVKSINSSPRRKLSPLTQNNDENGGISRKIRHATSPIRIPVNKPAKMDRQFNNPSSKGIIRRSPAFRCDKMVRGKNVVGHSSASRDKSSFAIDRRVKLFEDGENVKSVIKRLNSAGVSENNSNRDSVSPPKEPSVLPAKKLEIDRKLVAESMNNVVLNAITSKKVVNTNGKPMVSPNVQRDFLKNSESLRKSESLPIKSNPNIEEVSLNVGYAAVLKIPKVSSPLFQDTQFPLRPERRKVKIYTEGPTPIQEAISQANASVPNPANHVDNEETTGSRMTSEIHDMQFNEPYLNMSRSDLSNTLKVALQAPLPTGPPPKKPPRTFAHNSPMPFKEPRSNPQNAASRNVPMTMSNDISSTNHVNDGKLSKSITESHIMLKKLEMVLLNHQQGIGNIIMKPKSPLVGRAGEQDENSKLVTSRVGPLPEIPSRDHKGEARFGGCLNCVSDQSYTAMHYYEKLPEAQSRFFVDQEERVSSLQESGATTFLEAKRRLYGTLHKSRSEEHIYAEPFEFLRDAGRGGMDAPATRLKSGDSVGDLTKSASEKIQKVLLSRCLKPKPEGLHYLCTPIRSPSSIRKVTDTSNKIKLLEALNQELVSSAIQPGNDADMNGEEKFASAQQRRPPSLLRFTGLNRGSQNNLATDPANKLDRNKIQLLMNQAFGSPLQGLPTTPIDSTNSDSDSVTSTPDEDGFFHIFRPVEETAVEALQEASPPRPVAAGLDHSRQSPDLNRLTEQRKVYVRRVSSRVLPLRDSMPHDSHLYQCVLLVGLTLDPSSKIKVPYVKMKYPPKAEVPSSIEHLCFPDASDWQPFQAAEDSASRDDQSYSLVITDESGKRRFGYCRRVLPEGASICLPLAYCIISPYRATGFYFKVLSELESRHGHPEWLRMSFIKELYNCEFPSPGQGIRIASLSPGNPGNPGSGSGISVLQRPFDSRLEDRDLTQLFAALQFPVFMQVFGSILLERKVLFYSSSINKLSSCVGALESILYPFSWQHTFIPVVPLRPELEDLPHLPAPYIIGLLRTKDSVPVGISIEDGMVVDLDDSQVLECVGDEATILPNRLKRALKAALQLVASSTQPHESARNVLVSEAFVRMFVEVCGHYHTHIVTQQDGRKVFERESFIKAMQSRSVRLFLEWFTETAMFSAFLDSRLEVGPDLKSMFEQRVSEHSEAMDKNTMLFLRNYKAINKKVKTLGDRLKDWTPFT